MAFLVLGALVLLLLIWAMHGFVRVDAKTLARGFRTAGGAGALAIAVGLAVTGRIQFAVPLGMAGLYLLGWLPGMPAPFAQRTQKSSGQVSRVRSAFVEMELHHDTGELQGTILAGRHEGTALASLDVPTLIGLLPDIDPDSQALLATYLDRRDPAWREHSQDHATAGRSRSSAGGPMTEEEAYQVLGLEAGAGVEQITRAHRSLMKKLHPDQGGSTYLAARVNEAKEVLLRRHRSP